MVQEQKEQEQESAEECQGSKEEEQVNQDDRICTICNGPFNLDTEGGVEGSIGILPVAFCPTCKAGVIDFVQGHCCFREVGCMYDEEEET